MNARSPGPDGSATRLADTLCARLCHDLSSPLGTLIGVLELALEDPGSAAETLPLASEAAVGMAQRLRLLRAAWGGDCGALSTSQLADLAGGLPKRVSADLDQLGGGPFPGPVARVLLNLMLLATEALPKGGRFTLSGRLEGDILLAVDGPGAGWPPGSNAMLTGSAPVTMDNPRGVAVPMVTMLAQQAGLTVRMLLTSGAAVSPVPPLLLSPG